MEQDAGASARAPSEITAANPVASPHGSTTTRRPFRLIALFALAALLPLSCGAPAGNTLARVQLQRVLRLVARQESLFFFSIAHVGKPDMECVVQAVPKVFRIGVVERDLGRFRRRLLPFRLRLFNAWCWRRLVRRGL